MKFPSRPLRYDPSLERPDYPYYDRESVVQDDGRIASFSGHSHAREKGWQFAGWRDAQRFWLLEGDEQTGEMARRLLDSTEEKNRARHEAWLEQEEAKRQKVVPEQGLGSFGKFAFPVLENMPHASILDELVAVQPMASPSSRTPVFELRFGPYTPPPPPTVAEDEVLHAYKYGGVLSERGGWFVTKKNDPTRVLRYRQDMMS